MSLSLVIQYKYITMKFKSQIRESVEEFLWSVGAFIFFIGIVSFAGLVLLSLAQSN